MSKSFPFKVICVLRLIIGSKGALQLSTYDIRSTIIKIQSSQHVYVLCVCIKYFQQNIDTFQIEVFVLV